MDLLTTQALAISFGDNRAVDGVDFSVKQGEVLALIGSNGAGKTTLVNLISGLMPPDSGHIIFEDRNVTRQSSYERIKAGIARSFQIVNLFDQLSCADNVALSIFSREGKTLNLAALASRDRAVWEEAHDVLRRFGLDRTAMILAGAISHGSASCSTSRSPTRFGPSCSSSTSRPAAYPRARRRRSWTSSARSSA